jgi:branched-chain amino acid transport system substrate-binding protein
MKKWLFGWLTLLLAFTFGFAGGPEPIKIGALVSATGPASFLGDPELKTLKHYAEKINHEGGIDGRRIELVAYDTGANPKKAVTFAKRLIFKDKVDAIIGPSTTGETMAIIPLVEKNKVPLLSMAGGVAIIEPVKPWVFKIVATDRMACEKIMEDMKKKNISKIAMISGSGGFGKSMRKQCKMVADKMGISILADETYGKKDTDMTAQLLKIKNTPGVQAVLNPGFGQGPAIVAKNYKQLQMEQPLYESHGVASKKFIEIAGPAAEGVRLVSPPVVVAEKLPDSNPVKKVCMEYKKEYESTFKTPVSSFGGHAYDALFAVVDAVKRGATDRQSIRDNLESMKGFVGIDGVVNMSPTDHLGLDTKSGMVNLAIKNGDWELAE